MFLRSSVICRLVVLLAIVVTVSCHLGTDLLAKSKSRTPVTSIVKDLKMSPEELRVRLRALVRPILGIIEEKADRIIANTSDPAVRRGAIVLKIEMTTTMLAAMLRSDPVLALADGWGYVIQVEYALPRPELQARYGKSAADRALEALALVERQFRDFVAGVRPGPFAEKFASVIRRWADRHPIEGALYRRPSIDSAVAELLASSGAGGVFAALGDLDETVADVMTRMDLYTMYLPRLARWEAELAVDDLTQGVDPRTLSTEFERLTRAADRLAAVAETASDLAARERASALDAIRRERIVVLDAVQKERIATLHEIEAIAQRLADRFEIEVIAQRLVDRSGPLLHDAVRTDLKDLVESVEEMRGRLMVESGETLVFVVDHAFFRLVQLLLIFAGLVALGLALYICFFRRRRM